MNKLKYILGNKYSYFNTTNHSKTHVWTIKTWNMHALYANQLNMMFYDEEDEKNDGIIKP